MREMFRRVFGEYGPQQEAYGQVFYTNNTEVLWALEVFGLDENSTSKDMDKVFRKGRKGKSLTH